jgi:hypothetical protein
VADVHGTGFASDLMRDPVNQDGDDALACRILPGGLAASVACTDPVDDGVDRIIRAIQRLLALEGGLNPATQPDPLLLWSGRQVAQGHDGLLSRALGGTDGLDEEVVDVSLLSDLLDCLADEHRTYNTKYSIP